MPGLIEHIERYLGTIQRGWPAIDPAGRRLPFQIVECRGGVVENVAAFVTLGLSRIELGCPVSSQRIRHELLFLAPSPINDTPIPSLLQQVGEEVIRNGTALLRGDVLGPRGRLFGGSLEALYVTAPVYYPDEFSGCVEEGTDRVIAWLVPITVEEAAYVRSRGWDAFESLLTQRNPDLIDPARTSIV